MNEKKYSTLEIACVFCWFLLDGFWLMEWKHLTYTFSGLALAFAAGMLFYLKRERAAVLITCADMAWLSSNILWAFGDMDHKPAALLAAKIGFGVGFAFCVTAFVACDIHTKALALSRVRIINVFRRYHEK